MRHSHFLATALFCVAGGIAAFAAVPLEGRTVPLQVIQAPKTRVFNKVIPTGDTAIHTFDFTTTSPLPEHGFGLFVPNATDAHIWLNDQLLETDPVKLPDGLAYKLPDHHVKLGPNSVRIWRAPEPVDGSAWVGTSVFSLNRAEDMHFGSAMVALAPPPADKGASDKARLPNADQLKYDVLSYDCYWQPDMTAALQTNGSTYPPQRALSSRITSATVAITAQNISGSPLNNFVLDFDRNLDQNNALTPSSPAPITVSRIDSGPGTASIGGFSFNDAEDLLTIPLSPAVPAGATFTIRVGYSGYPSVYYTEAYAQIAPPYSGNTHNGSPVIYTASQPYGARRWFPCKDVPEDKAATTIQRINVPTGQSLKTVSNGVLQGVEPGPEPNTETWVWVNNAPIPTYLIAMYASNYSYSNGNYLALDGITNMPVSHAIYPENVGSEGSGAAGTIQVLNVFRNYFGEYPFVNQKYGTATWNISYGIENQTATGMPGASQHGASASVGNGLTGRNIHELAHQWWGDSVTYANFDHLWLGEGFATYAEALWEEGRPGGGPTAYRTEINGQRGTADNNASTPIVGPNADRVLGQPAYERGSWVLHMLRHVVGDEAFFQSLKQYQQQYKHTSTVSQDFENVVESISGKDLTNFFQQWLYRTDTAAAPTFPRYAWSGTASETGGVYSVAVNIFQMQGGTIPFDQPIDVRITASNGQTHTVLVPSSTFSSTVNLVTGTTVPVSIDLDPDDWILSLSDRISIRTVGLTNAQINSPFSYVLSATGGTTPRSFTLRAGAPAWVSLTTAGTLSGTAPAAPGTYAIPIRVTDNGGNIRDTTLNLKVIDPSIPIPPASPSNMTATPSVSDIALTWTDNANNETGFTIERKRDDESDFSILTTIAQANANSYTDNTVAADHEYCYRVSAYNSGGTSPASNTDCATRLAPPAPAAPSNLSAIPTLASVSLTWNDNSNNEEGFELQRKRDDELTFSLLATVGPNTTQHLDQFNLVPGRQYCYRVLAFNGPTDSSFSNVVCVTIPTESVEGHVSNPGGSGDLFGYSIAKFVAGKQVGFIVGAPGADSGVTSDTGRAYLFYPPSTTPTLVLENPATESVYGNFGFSVGAIGSSVVVGAPGPETAFGNGGRVYMFDAATGALQRTVSATTPLPGERFGHAVSAIGKTDIVIGAPSPLLGGGRTYIYNLKKQTTVTLESASAAPGTQFGYAVAGGKGKLGVVSLGGDCSRGHVDIFTKKGALYAGLDEAFSIASVNGKFLVGAPLHLDCTDNKAGWAYLMAGKLPGIFYANPQAALDDAFGYSVAGGKKFVGVGAALFDETGAQDAGRAYLYRVKSTLPADSFANPQPAAGDHFGHSMAIAEGMKLPTKQKLSMIAIGAPYSDENGLDGGAVYFFEIPLK